MKFSLISDMHLDHPQPKTPYDLLEENVVVAGDTANGLLGLKFLNKLRNKGFNVYACDGNHEHYSNVGQGRDYIETLERFQEDFSPLEDIEGVPLVIVNGWYQVSNEHLWYRSMNDGRFADLTADRVNQIAMNDAKMVEYALQRWKEGSIKGIVTTHTAPCTETLDPRYEDDPSNEWYWNPYMRQLIEMYPDQIAVWCHGHTHAFADKQVNGVRVVCNPRGYPGENPMWKPLTVDLNEVS